MHTNVLTIFMSLYDPYLSNSNTVSILLFQMERPYIEAVQRRGFFFLFFFFKKDANTWKNYESSYVGLHIHEFVRCISRDFFTSASRVYYPLFFPQYPLISTQAGTLGPIVFRDLCVQSLFLRSIFYHTCAFPFFKATD